MDLYRWLRLKAGTGKSTLVKFIVSALDIPEKDICYVAYTGKAATVLKKKGNDNAITAHKLLYKAIPTEDGGFIFKQREKIDYKLVIVDEVSMLPRSMWELLLTYKVHVIATGDPGQLPPIDKSEDNGILNNPHIFLDEIMRQAQDSEIIRLSMWIREGKPLNTFPCKKEQVQIFLPNETSTGMFSWADQILCATNPKRNDINNFMRQQKGYDKTPCVGDKIISLNNHWDFLSTKNEWPLINGVIGTLKDSYLDIAYLPKYINSAPIEILQTTMELEEEEDFYLKIPIDYKQLLTGENSLTDRQKYLLRKNRKTVNPPFEFAYAYAITTHKAQGSEWDKVLIFEEKFPFNKEEHKRWLYTAITRAKEKVVIIKNS